MGSFSFYGQIHKISKFGIFCSSSLESACRLVPVSLYVGCCVRVLCRFFFFLIGDGDGMPARGQACVHSALPPAGRGERGRMRVFLVSQFGRKW